MALFHSVLHSARKYYTLDNLVLLVAVMIALGWIWATMDTLQNNFRLQAEVNQLEQQVQQSDLETQNLALENQYYASPEYQEIEARKRLNKAAPGEHLLLLPPNIQDSSTQATSQGDVLAATPNLQAWLNFFFGRK